MQACYAYIVSLVGLNQPLKKIKTLQECVDRCEEERKQTSLGDAVSPTRKTRSTELTRLVNIARNASSPIQKKEREFLLPVFRISMIKPITPFLISNQFPSSHHHHA
jgi:hypothetical protein